MIHSSILRALAGAVLAIGFCQAGSAQTTDPNAPENSFSLDAAILDTSIPFAVGAHEARQELRGAFGWPTFQEGLVEGVYFRFDPDGYARFAATPRLDTDIFEVICRPRTHMCMARKGPMSVTLNSKNQIQLEIENTTETDAFSIIDGVSQLNLPSDILLPLDSRMEILLSEGGDLLVTRAQKEVDRISLTGFAAVTAYLRWVSAQQDYIVLPRDWPIPNASPSAPSALLTQAASWQSPMAQPTTFGSADRDPEVAEVRGELNVLREMIFDQPKTTEMSVSSHENQTTSLDELQLALQMLGDEVAKLRSEGVATDRTRVSKGQDMPESTQPGPPPVATQESHDFASFQAGEMHETLLHLNYLISVMKMEPAEAIRVLFPEVLAHECIGKLPVEAEVNQYGTNASVENSQFNQDPMRSSDPAVSVPVPDGEYQLLSNYFRSVFEAR
ncbi:MAG: hypothetical protein JXQ85_13790 [Cognatishimia sp.]|uniref:hypothetical protein n=1 Tax=Cognatishimia sp. TaxID=2211648 RepID=UPI003B8E0EE7